VAAINFMAFFSLVISSSSEYTLCFRSRQIRIRPERDSLYFPDRNRRGLYSNFGAEEYREESLKGVIAYCEVLKIESLL
jgi:hypothetical protein